MNGASPDKIRIKRKLTIKSNRVYKGKKYMKPRINLPFNPINAMQWKDGDDLEISFVVNSTENKIEIRNPKRQKIDALHFLYFLFDDHFKKLEEKVNIRLKKT